MEKIVDANSTQDTAWIHSALTGAEAGALATAGMSALMATLQRSGLLGKMPPRIVTDEILATVGIKEHLNRRSRIGLATVSHFAFGALQGGLYALLLRLGARRRSDLNWRPSPFTSVPFALLVWAASYAGWIPALGIMLPPSDDRPGRPFSMVVSHVAFGVALASALQSLLRERQAQEYGVKG